MRASKGVLVVHATDDVGNPLVRRKHLWWLSARCNRNRNIAVRNKRTWSGLVHRNIFCSGNFAPQNVLTHINKTPVFIHNDRTSLGRTDFIFDVLRGGLAIVVNAKKVSKCNGTRLRANARCGCEEQYQGFGTGNSQRRTSRILLTPSSKRCQRFRTSDSLRQ
jgi:hypothetical protein